MDRARVCGARDRGSIPRGDADVRFLSAGDLPQGDNSSRGHFMKTFWALVNCNSFKEADLIGKVVLRKRLVGCFDVVPRLIARYFWPPRSRKIESAKGCILILTTVEKNFSPIQKLVKKFHSDKVPFIGSVEIKNINPDYLKWFKQEITNGH